MIRCIQDYINFFESNFLLSIQYQYQLLNLTLSKKFESKNHLSINIYKDDCTHVLTAKIMSINPFDAITQGDLESQTVRKERPTTEHIVRHTNRLVEFIIENMCIVIAFLIANSLLFSLSVAAISIHAKYGNDLCIGSYSGISFGYDVWLNIYGWTNISLIIFILIMLLVCVYYEWLQPSCVCLIKFVAVLAYFFQFSWYIVGSVLYFQEVNSNCQSGRPIHDFGLALFIIQTICWGASCLGAKQASKK